MEHLIGNWEDVLAWVAVLAVLVVTVRAVARTGRRPKASPLVKAAVVEDLAEPRGPYRLDPRLEWSLVLGHAARDLDRGAALPALQSQAELKLAAAEHAFNRLVSDYAKLCPQSVASAIASPSAPGSHRPRLASERPAGRRRLAA